jgi:hypothetical protein
MDYFRNTQQGMCGIIAEKVYSFCRNRSCDWINVVMNLVFSRNGIIKSNSLAEHYTPAFIFSKDTSSFTIGNLLFSDSNNLLSLNQD